MIKLSELTPYKKNPREISEVNMSKLMDSIKTDPEFLAKRKILVNKTEEGNIIYGGNQRYQALVNLWYNEIPDEWVDFEEDIDKELMEARMMKDNTEYGEYDVEVLLEHFDKDWVESLELPDYEFPMHIWEEDNEPKQDNNWNKKEKSYYVTFFFDSKDDMDLFTSEMESLGYTNYK